MGIHVKNVEFLYLYKHQHLNWSKKVSRFLKLYTFVISFVINIFGYLFYFSPIHVQLKELQRKAEKIQALNIIVGRRLLKEWHRIR
jgi:hypothetical protein